MQARSWYNISPSSSVLFLDVLWQVLLTLFYFFFFFYVRVISCRNGDDSEDQSEECVHVKIAVQWRSVSNFSQI